jgi:hypothetical protein
MNAVDSNPFLQLEFLTRVVKDMVVVNPNYTIIDNIVPSVEQSPALGTSIEWDIDVYDEGGMIPLSDPRATSSLVTGGAHRTKRWSPPHYRVKRRLDATDFKNLRELGARTQQRSIGREMIKWMARLRRMVDNRQLYSKWAAIQEPAAFNVHGAGITQRLDYSGCGFHPTVLVNWDAPGAQIIDDIIDMIGLFRTEAIRPTKAMYGTQVMSAMLADATIRAIINQHIFRRVNEQNIFNTTPGQTGIGALLKSMFGDMEFDYYQEGPPVSLRVPRGSTGTTIPVVGSPEFFNNGDTAHHIQPDGTTTEITITTLNPNAGTLFSGDLAGIPSPRGTIIRKRFEFIRYNQFVMFGEVPTGGSYPGTVESDGVDSVAELVSVLNEHGDGGLDRPQSGIGLRIIDKKDDDPPSKEIIISYTGGVVVYRERGCWLSGSVLA